MASSTDGLPATTASSLRLEAERLQREGDFEAAFKAYEQAVSLAPDDPDLLSALARLAGQVGMHEVAVQLWAVLHLSDPTAAPTCDGYARALIALARFPEAIEVLKSGLQQRPEEGRLWTTLGLALTYAGRADEALTFFNEGVRLTPGAAAAIYNRGLALCDLGRLADAESDFQSAAGLAREASERATIEFSLATTTLARGDLASGWALYERRLSPDAPTWVDFQGPGRRLDTGEGGGEPLAGRAVLVFAEQGIGDELLFANTLPDLIADIGPDGRLVVAVETRLVELFQRSFPTAEVCAHATPRAGTRLIRRTREPVGGRIDLWAPMASLAQRYRRALGDFPGAPYLRPDPARVAHWRAWLGERPAIGLTWRSGTIAGDRQRLSPPLEQWAELLRTPGVQFVNLQYGECEADLTALTAWSGVEVRRPPELNIRDDLDDLAALCAALDGVVGIQNATSVLAAACGTPVAFLAGPGAWFQLGQQKAPWFADAPVCTTDRFSDWTPAMTAAAGEIGRIVTAGSGRSAGAVAPPTADNDRSAGPALAEPRRKAGGEPAVKVVCVLRSGGDYAPRHVERLQRQLARHLPGAELTCLSDVHVPCRRIALRQDWSGVRGWWAKMELFAPWVEGDLLYFDLDISLVGDLAEIAAVRSLTVLEDFNFGHLNSGLMFLPAADRPRIWETFMRDPAHWIREYDDPQRQDARWGDQAFLADHGLDHARRWQSLVPDQIWSYKAHDLARRGMPPNARIVCFHGQPRPWSPDVAPEFRGD